MRINLTLLICLAALVATGGCSGTGAVGGTSSPRIIEETKDRQTTPKTAKVTTVTAPSSVSKEAQQERPWETDCEYQEQQVALLERLLASKQRELHQLDGAQREQTLMLMSSLDQQITDQRAGSMCGAAGAARTKPGSKVQYMTDQLAMLQNMKEKQEQNLASLDGPERARALLFIDTLSQSIEDNEKALADAKSLEAAQDTVRDARTNGAAANSNALASSRNSPSFAAGEGRTNGSGSNSNALASSNARTSWSPKIPFYIPGTSETGIIRLGLSLTSTGAKQHALQFFDDSSGASSPRDSVALSSEDLDELRSGLFKLHKWSDQAQTEKIRKSFTKTATCLPKGRCDSNTGGIVTQVRFLIYEDGSTAGQFQLRKGNYYQPYNLSVESALLLQSYLSQSLKSFSRTTRNAGLTDKDLHDHFR